MSREAARVTGTGGPRGEPGSIHVDRLWKRFRADKAPRSLRDKLVPNKAGRHAGSKYRWVLRDISLDLAPGDAVGLIGNNGSGKSTLLKILTGVMYPYAGAYQVNGRVGALLEVRAGLHMDLSGRENIYLYGGLLGLTKAQVTERFDDIVEFAVLEDAIDRQVKFYSSGMGMRLGFSVAAFLEPDILLVDEALAVGDAFFQQRCLDRIRDLLHNGTSLVLVSHDLAAVESVCGRGVWLKDGVIQVDTDARGALAAYRNWYDDAYNAWIDDTHSETQYQPSNIEVVKAEVTGARGGIPRGQDAMRVDLALDSPHAVQGELSIGVTEGTASPLFLVTETVDLRQGSNEITCTIPHIPLAAGRYYLWLQFDGGDSDSRIAWQPTGPFMVQGEKITPTPVGVMRATAVQVGADWQVKGDE